MILSSLEAAGGKLGWGGEGRGCRSRLARRRQKPEQDEGGALVKAIYTMYRLRLISPLGWQRPRRGQGRRKGRAGRPTPSWHSRGRGGSPNGASRHLPVQKRGENSLNNSTELRLSPRRSPRPGAGARPQRSLCRGLGALAAAFLPFTVLRELHHVVLLLLLLFRQVVLLCPEDQFCDAVEHL